MNANEYQKAAYKFAAYGENTTYAYAGLAEEAGEVLGKFAKFIRKHQGLEPRAASNWETFKEDYEKYRTELKKELGDVLWYISNMSVFLDISLSDIAKTNLDKLESRWQRGKLHGEGDER